MGWDIYVGNAVIAKPYPDDERFHLTVEPMEHPDAPEWPSPDDGFADISGKSNHRAPSYSGLAEFVRAHRVNVPAFGARGSDGDCFILTPSALASVRQARRRHEKACGKPPGWRPGEDADLAKLIWYEWWFAWALATCERPAIRMS